MNIKEWNPGKDALDLKEHFTPLLTQPIICKHCNKRHFPDEDTFIVIYGNITVGFGGGIVGNNFHKDGTLCRVAVFCRTIKCIGGLLFSLVATEEDLKKEQIESEFDKIIKKFNK